MKYFALLILCCIKILANAQYYSLPEWIEDIPYSNSSTIFSFGISDPRMTDSILAEKIAVNRALCLAVIADEAEVLLTADYFEKKNEEYRWIITKDDIEELTKISAKAYIDETLYSIVDKQINKNGETLVLIKYTPTKSKNPNFFVDAEYYRKEFEISNTRSLESVKNIVLKSKWKNEKFKDTIFSIYDLTIWNNDITTHIKYDNEEIHPPGYSYEYKSTIPSNFDISVYTSNSIVKKGLWLGFIETLMNSITVLSKNYQSKFSTVSDDYKVSRDDGIYEITNESLSRSVSKNNLKFEYGGIGINNNRIYSRIYLKGYRPPYISYSQKEQATLHSINNANKHVCLFKRIFKNTAVW